MRYVRCGLLGLVGTIKHQQGNGGTKSMFNYPRGLSMFCEGGTASSVLYSASKIIAFQCKNHNMFSKLNCVENTVYLMWCDISRQ